MKKTFLTLLFFLMVGASGPSFAQTAANSQALISIQQARILNLEAQLKQITGSVPRLIRADFTGGSSQGPANCQESCSQKSASCVGVKHLEFYGGGGFSGSYWAARTCDYKIWSNAQCLCSIYDSWPAP